MKNSLGNEIKFKNRKNSSVNKHSDTSSRRGSIKSTYSMNTRSHLGKHYKKSKNIQKTGRYDEQRNEELLDIVASDLVMP